MTVQESAHTPCAVREKHAAIQVQTRIQSPVRKHADNFLQLLELFDYIKAAEIDLYKAPSETRVYFTSSFFTHCVNVVTKRRVAMGVWV